MAPRRGPTTARRAKPAPPADGAATSAAAAAAPTVGQRTSHIKNKLVRGEAYAKLKRAKSVSRGW